MMHSLALFAEDTCLSAPPPTRGRRTGALRRRLRRAAGASNSQEALRAREESRERRYSTSPGVPEARALQRVQELTNMATDLLAEGIEVDTDALEARRAAADLGLNELQDRRNSTANAAALRGVPHEPLETVHHRLDTGSDQRSRSANSEGVEDVFSMSSSGGRFSPEMRVLDTGVQASELDALPCVEDPDITLPSTDGWPTPDDFEEHWDLRPATNWMTRMGAIPFRANAKQDNDDKKGLPIHLLDFNSMCRPCKIAQWKIPYRLNRRQAGALALVLGGNRTDWTVRADAPYHDHPACALVRLVAYVAALRFLDGYRVLDIGGSVQRAVAAQARNMHCCMPTLDRADAVRRVTQRMGMAVKNINVKEECAFEELVVTACRNRVEDCKAEADAFLCVDSIYYLGEPYIINLMRRHELGVILYHSFEHSCDHYLGEARVRLIDKDGVQFVAMWVEGNSEPYIHPNMNIHSNSESQIYRREGKPLRRFHIASWGWYHMVVYCWGDLPVGHPARPWGSFMPRWTPDKRGIAAPPGIPIRTDLANLSTKSVIVRIMGIDRTGVAITAMVDHLVATFSSKLHNLAGVDQLLGLMRMSYLDQMRKVNAPDGYVAIYEPGTVYVAAYELLKREVATRGGIHTGSFWRSCWKNLLARLLGTRGAPCLPFDEVYTPDCWSSLTPTTPPGPGVANFDLVAELASNGSVPVFRGAAAVGWFGFIRTGTAAAAW